MGPFWRALIDFFFPSQCPICGKILDENSLGRPCPSCLSQIKFFSHPYCPRCGLGFNTAMGEDHLCSGCLTEHWDFTKARSIGPYEGLMAEVISRFKFGEFPVWPNRWASSWRNMRILNSLFQNSISSFLFPFTPNALGSVVLINPCFWPAALAGFIRFPSISRRYSASAIPNLKPNSPVPNEKRISAVPLP